MIWGMFMTVTMESAVFMGNNNLDNCQSIVNTTNKCSTYLRNWCQNKRRSQDWKRLLGKSFMEIPVINW